MLWLAGDQMWYRAGADAIVIVHLLFICFVVAGAFLSWRWPRLVWVHLPAVIYGALVELAGFTCPLTLLENELRRRAGEVGYGGGFIDRYLIKVIYPPGLTHGMQIGLGLLVLLVAMLGYWGFLRRRKNASGGLLRSWRRQCPPGPAPVHPSPSRRHRLVPGGPPIR